MLRSTEVVRLASASARYLLIVVVLGARTALAVCGDGIPDPGEACDDGNLAAGDCCGPTCTSEPAGDPCADDGNPCSLDVCDGTGICTHPTGGTAACDDGDPCTTNDACGDGVCRGTLVVPGTCIDTVLCRRARPTGPSPRLVRAGDDGFTRFFGPLGRARELCLPASTTGAPLVDPAIALVSSRIGTGGNPFISAWRVTDQFGTRDLEMYGVERMLIAGASSLVDAVPTAPPSGSANHYACRRARLASGSGAPQGITTTVDDILGSRTGLLGSPRRLCRPADVDASGTGKAHPRSFLMCYGLRIGGHTSGAPGLVVETASQLGSSQLEVFPDQAQELCVPADAERLRPPPPPCVTSGDECGLPCCREFAGQRPDCAYDPVVSDPRYLGCAGPTILFDHTHANFHQVTPESGLAPGRFWGFAKLLARDGYVVRDSTVRWPALLAATSAKIFAMANPQALLGPVAVPPEDVAALVTWVEEGGSLFLSIDHPPFEKTDALLAAFGLEQLGRGARQFTFTVTNGGLNAAAPVADGIAEVTTFTGTGFRISSSPPPQASYEIVLIYPPGAPNNLAGWLQGVTIEFGAGRVYVSGESGGLTAQNSFGMQETPDNEQFVRNIIHWLDD